MDEPQVYHARAMAEYLTLDQLEADYAIRIPGDGEILCNPSRAYFRGDSSLVAPLVRLTGTHFGGWRPAPGEPLVFAIWTGLGGCRLALETVEPRFKNEWRHLLPPEIANADTPEFERPHRAKPGVVY